MKKEELLTELAATLRVLSLEAASTLTQKQYDENPKLIMLIIKSDSLLREFEKSLKEPIDFDVVT